MPGVLTTTLPTEDIYRPREVLTGPQTPTGRAGGAPGGPPGRAEMGEGAGGRWGARGPFFDTPKFFDIPKLASWRWAQTLDPPPGAPARPLPPGVF